jgi:NAD(P)-dependent dehydrogenase (short-subunit alcohol dehydrogenase family)
MEQRVAVVTGAGSGIGRAVALALLDAGYRVALAGRRAEPLNETARLSKAGSSIVLPTDVTDPASVDALFAEVKAKLGHLDVLFNNAGVSTPATNFGDVTFEQWQSVVAVNINGMFLCASGAYRMMRDQTPHGGRIINNGSISAMVPRPGSAAYTASKHAVTGMTKSISLDGRGHNIVASQIDIGNAATDMTARMAIGVPQANGTMAVEPTMPISNVVSTVLIANMGLEANVQFVTVMASGMPYIGRG